MITSFGVANAISVPLTGWLTQRFGAVRLFTASVLLFVLASWLCGLAGSLETLIGYRVLQGLVGRADDPAVADLAVVELPARESRHGLGDVGHDDTCRASHRAFARGLDHRQRQLALDLLHQRAGGPAGCRGDLAHLCQARDAHQDLADRQGGLALLVLWVGALQIMLDKGKELDWFESGEIIALGVVALVGFVVFLIWEAQ